MLRITLAAAAAGAVLVQTVGDLRPAPGLKDRLTPEERAILSHMKLVYANDGHGQPVPTIRIEGVNVQIVNGQGSTQSTNGRGNLILGYQVGTTIERTGSHNLVVGDDHTYTSYGGMVSGVTNQLHAPNAVALTGEGNAVRGERCAIVGGTFNEVDGVDNVVVASDECSIGVGAEWCAVIGAEHGSVSDGDNNMLLGGQGNSIGGGSYNAVVTGVSHNLLASDYVGIVSGEDHDLFLAAFAAVLGGQHHSATQSYHAAFVGGAENSATDWGATVVGGEGNRALNYRSTVGGGFHRTASGEYDWVAGGLFQDQ